MSSVKMDFRATESEVNKISIVMTELNIGKSEAIRYLINNNFKYDDMYYKNLIFKGCLAINDALNDFERSGNTKPVYDAVEVLKCQIL